jgi:transcriptional regulator with XRE-family HTH domain
MTTAERIIRARQSAGLTQDEAATRKGCGRKYWSDVETGKRVPSLDWVCEAATAIGCKPSELDQRLAD